VKLLLIESPESSVAPSESSFVRKSAFGVFFGSAKEDNNFTTTNGWLANELGVTFAFRLGLQFPTGFWVGQTSAKRFLTLILKTSAPQSNIRKSSEVSQTFKYFLIKAPFYKANAAVVSPLLACFAIALNPD
jgi:hypothetical protein